MPAQTDKRAARHDRQLIASAAARLIAEDGIDDYAKAKRKAAQQLGLQRNDALPDDAEVECELRRYQHLFQDEAHREELAFLRGKAAELMRHVERFNPYLSGSVLEGTASEHAEIDIQLYTDSAKDVEIFLLNQGMDYAHSTPRSSRAEAVLTVQLEGATANLIVYPVHDERVVFRGRDGRVRARARLDAVCRMINPDASPTAVPP